MDRVLILLAALMLVTAAPVYAQPLETLEEDNESGMAYQESKIFRCEPDVIPETSILKKTEKDIKRLLDPQDYRESYPDYCEAWSKVYLHQEDGNVTDYRVEVLKFQDRSEAVLAAERNGDRLSYAEVRVNNESVGATNARGMLRINLSEAFEATVETSDRDIGLSIE